jgi:hypothetical protein
MTGKKVQITFEIEEGADISNMAFAPFSSSESDAVEPMDVTSFGDTTFPSTYTTMVGQIPDGGVDADKEL